MENEPTRIKSHLSVKASKELKSSIEKDLEISDPDEEKAKAILNEAMGIRDEDEEEDDEEKEEEEEDQQSVDEAGHADNRKDSDGQKTE